MSIRSLTRLAALSVFAAAQVQAAPVVLDSDALDRITAGNLSFLGQFQGLLAQLPVLHLDLLNVPALPMLASDLAAWLPAAFTEPLSFQKIDPGTLAATFTLAGGQQLVLVRPDGAAPAAMAPTTAATAASADGSVKTWFLQPGETLSQQRRHQLSLRAQQRRRTRQRHAAALTCSQPCTGGPPVRLFFSCAHRSASWNDRAPYTVRASIFPTYLPKVRRID
ncbi:hypothetical protein E4K72_18920 [Oxalobacteraceae bacterium OM1]|nr:hypothetical protein E4K72_18920 [Oxalobacteraceae bacterium OM1]